MVLGLNDPIHIIQHLDCHPCICGSIGGKVSDKPYFFAITMPVIWSIGDGDEITFLSCDQMQCIIGALILVTVKVGSWFIW